MLPRDEHRSRQLCHRRNEQFLLADRERQVGFDMQAVAERLDSLVVTPAGDVVSGSRYRWIGGEDNIWFRVIGAKCAESEQGGPGASTLPASDHEAMLVVDTPFRHPISKFRL